MKVKNEQKQIENYSAIGLRHEGFILKYHRHHPAYTPWPVRRSLGLTWIGLMWLSGMLLLSFNLETKLNRSVSNGPLDVVVSI